MSSEQRVNTEDSDRCKALFTTLSRDITPLKARQAATVLHFPMSQAGELGRYCPSLLSKAERARADRFACAGDRMVYILSRAFRRYCGVTALDSRVPFSKIVFEETPKGQPYLSGAPGLGFSFSSCRLGILGAWSKTRSIGVDIEDNSKTLEAAVLARHYFTTSEAEAVVSACSDERRLLFYRLWCLKEAALKSIGEGLPYGLHQFAFELDPGVCVTRSPATYGEPEWFDAHLIEGSSLCAALVARDPAGARDRP